MFDTTCANVSGFIFRFSRSSYRLCRNLNFWESVVWSVAKPLSPTYRWSWILWIFRMYTAVVCCWLIPNRKSDAIATQFLPTIAGARGEAD